MAENSREELNNFLTPDYVDLSALPAPKVIEELNFETIFQEMLADFKSKKPDYTALLESDPVIIALQCAAYRELLLRHRINEAAKASMLAYATGADLDNLAAFYDIERMVIDEGSPDAIPPIPPTYEDDTRLRLRTQLALESFTTAGSEKAYIFHTLSASTKVKSVHIDSPTRGQVLITILSTEGDGTADGELIKEVEKYVSAEDKRPLTDEVIVQSAEIVPYTVKAKVYVYPGPSIPVVEREYKETLKNYVAKRQKIGGIVARSGIYDAIHTEGVQKVELITPADDITPSKTQAAYCTDIELEVLVVNE